MAEPTPGPWEAVEEPHVAEPDHTYWSIRGGIGYLDREDAEPSGFELSGFIRQEDAHLIAAAPELLEACRLFAEWSANETMDDPPRHPSLADVTLAIDAAIARAEGRDL